MFEKKEITRDSVWSRKVRERDHNYCLVGIQGCQTIATQSHHIFGRVHKKLRFDVDDGISVCGNCHRDIENMTKREAAEICKKIIGDDWWNRLADKKKKYYGVKEKI